ncbi:MAG: NAD-dependent epimerase/dehydratase family protein [Candidatus Obscuribacterales bacterium]|nr:NAD-dependent epimerase/dehydratase family protein [Candidatus Obscuribacterales bacterium]
MPKLFITGATGYIGSAVARVFKENGYEIHALTRSAEKEAEIKALGYIPVRGEMSDQQVLAESASAADAVIHAAADYERDVNQQDQAAVDAILKALEGSNKPFVYTSGIWVIGNTTTAATERSALNPIKLVEWRVGREQEVLSAARNGIRTIVLRPGIVYGQNGGIVNDFIEMAKKEKQARYIDTGNNRWPVVHVDDLADLYLLAVEKAKAGSLYHATNEKTVTVREVAESIARAIGCPGKTAAWTLDEALKFLGGFAAGLALDQDVDSSLARKELAWIPRRSRVADDIDASCDQPSVSGVK